MKIKKGSVKLSTTKEAATDGLKTEKSQTSEQQSDVQGESVVEFVKRMNTLGKSKMLAEHDRMRQKERHITFFMKNKKKNRYPQIVLFNEGAVILDVTKNDEPNDQYIHATKLKGKFGNYVLAQSPKNSTLNSWYRMIWQLKITVIVCLIPLTGKDKCAKYFEKKEGKKLKQRHFTVKTLASREEGVITTFDLKFTNKYDPEERMIHVLVFANWQDILVPPDCTELLTLMRATWALEKTTLLDKKSPTLVHGVSGTRRTGAYVLMSMLCRQMTDRQKLSIVSACTTVRSYRYGVMNSRRCFFILLLAVLTFAADNGFINRTKQSYIMAREFVRKAAAAKQLDICLDH